MWQALSKILILSSSFWLMACSSIVPNDPPKVNLVSVIPTSGDSMTPSFDINLRVVNPNKQALSLAGAVYTLSLNGHEVVTGATSDLPEVPGYGEANFTLPAQANLIATFRLLGSLVQLKSPELDYKVDVKLDIGSLWPAVNLTEKGTFKLEDLGQQLSSSVQSL
ncbi:MULTISPECIES: LEA type 2 family protein [unclassified Agarivorans]|uniref:LEA type 2 family protein n=1 Tax=unclassified Agarivorans TaxID=2636026 RepID=UPI0026E345B5|nr:MULTISPECIES: LEA type 2 family protein [unclassified Agarivorans]MDO6685779.1 LEA type 2 family protein [Agarivorans sp. 3_MG-2023]MDO6716106.1 LEA type 2 family protein [Agarivorans sp. 2_MG-2023]